MKNILKLLKKSFKYIGFAFINLLVLFLTTTIIRKDKNLVIIGGWFGRRFADNSRYFYLTLNIKKRAKAVWVTKSKKVYKELYQKRLPVVYKWSFKSIYYHLRAKYHVIDQFTTDINALLSYNSIRINLWHGFPLKKIGSFSRNMISDKAMHSMAVELLKNFLRKSKIFSIGGWRNFHILATSKFAGKILGEAFTTKKIIIADYPRTCIWFDDSYEDFLLSEETELLETIDSFINNGKKIIGYFPTFRDKYPTLFLGTQDESALKDFIHFLEQNNLVLITKYHFAETLFHKEVVKSFNDDTNIVFIGEDLDIYPFLKRTHILITDYSSIYFDYLLLDRPIIFFPYDLDVYRTKDRGLIFEYEEFTPGDKAFNLDELKDFIIKNLENPYSYHNERQIIKNLIFKNPKPNCEEMVANILTDHSQN